MKPSLSPFRRRRPLALPAALVALAGCSGPTIGVTFSAKSIPIDVAFGKPSAQVLFQQVTAARSQPALVPVPAAGLGVIPVQPSSVAPETVSPGTGPLQFQPVPAGAGGSTPSTTTPPANPSATTTTTTTGPSQSTTTVPPPATCPPPPPNASSRQEAGEEVTGIPPVGSYPVEYVASFNSGNTQQHQSGTATFTVGQVQQGSGGASSFSVTTNLLGESGTFQYSVQPPGFSQVTPVGQASSGGFIALSNATGSGGYGYQASFHPSSGLELLPLPAAVGSSWQGEAADTSTGTVASVNGVVQAETLVGVCGGVVDTRESNATITTNTPNESITTTVQTYFATQYGGLPVEEVESYSGTAGGSQVSGSLTWVYDYDPGAPHQ